MLARSLVVSIMAHAIPVGFMLHESADMLEEPMDVVEDTLVESQAQANVDDLPPVRITIIDEVQPRKRVTKPAKVEIKQADPVVKAQTASTLPEPVVEAPVIEAQPDPPHVEELVETQPEVATMTAPTPAAQAAVEECPPDREGLIPITSSSWAIERNLVDFYATHLKELSSLAWVPAHKDASGKPDGFKVVLKKCSILRNGGLQSQDIVTDVGGVRVHSIFTAIKAYVKLRKKSIIPLTVKRNDQEITLTYELR